jgi:hypothetical protein
MKAILIDPETETLTEIDYDGNYQSIYSLIGCETFTLVQIADSDCIFVDAEGLLNNPQYFFKYRDYNQPLAGKGLVLGTDGRGESIAPTVTVEDLRPLITFPKLSIQGFEQREGKTTFMGKEASFLEVRPVFGPPITDDKGE